MPVDDILLEAEGKMLKSEEAVVHEFAGVRTSKASASLVENLMIEAYEGSSMRLLELASISTPERKMFLNETSPQSDSGNGNCDAKGMVRKPGNHVEFTK